MHRLAYAMAAAPLLLELGACFSCFVAGTPICTPDGDVPIEDIQVGQQVYSYDESRREVVIGRVSRRFVHEDMPYGSLVLSDGRQLGITGNHPVYLPEEGRYVEAATLTPAQVLLLLDAGSKTPALRREPVARGLHEVTGRATVYNFSVERYENYFAGAVLVHNKSLGCDDCVPAVNADISIERSGDGSGIIEIADPEVTFDFDCQGSSCTTQLSFFRSMGEPPYSVALRAKPDTGSRFDGWEGLCSGLYECRFDVSENKSTYTGRARFVRCQSGEWCPRYPTSQVRPDAFRGALAFSEPFSWVVANLPPPLDPTAVGASALWRFDGSRLTPVTSAGGSLFGISSRSSLPARAWAVGQSGKLVSLGLSSAEVRSSGTTSDLYGAWADEASDWFVGAAGTIVRWQNDVARSVPSNSTADLHGVFGVGANLAWAVGKQGTLLSWNGSTWSAVASGTTRDLYAIWGRSATDVWAVGAQGTILHFDGSAWSVVPSGTTADLLHVRENGAVELFASGRGGTLLRWNGAAWTTIISGTPLDIYSTWHNSTGALQVLIGDQVRALIP